MAAAYEILSDPKKRSIYDQYGEEGIKDSGYGNQMSAGLFINY